jgi:type IV secretion system protein VirB4
VASFALQPRPTKTVLARELDPRSALPYARHVTDQVIALDTQALIISFQLDGASFETADVRDLNDWHAKLNGAWRNLANDHLAVWHHLVRREHVGYPRATFRLSISKVADFDRPGVLRTSVMSAMCRSMRSPKVLSRAMREG